MTLRTLVNRLKKIPLAARESAEREKARNSSRYGLQFPYHTENAVLLGRGQTVAEQLDLELDRVASRLLDLKKRLEGLELEDVNGVTPSDELFECREIAEELVDLVGFTPPNRQQAA